MSGQNVQRPLDALGKSIDAPVLQKFRFTYELSS